VNKQKYIIIAYNSLNQAIETSDALGHEGSFRKLQEMHKKFEHAKSITVFKVMEQLTFDF